jgi:hypothetical protein
MEQLATKTASLLLASAMLIVPGSLAHADSSRVLASLDRVGADSQLGLDAAYTRYGDDELFGDFTTLRFDLHGRYVHPSGLGVAAALPFTTASEWVEGERETAIGNLSLAALHALSRGPIELFTRVGVVLPTADDEVGGVNALGGYGRLGDLMTGMPETTTLQLGVSPQFTQGRVFVRGDLGLDVLVDKPDEAIDELGPLAHVSAAVGAEVGPVDLAVESVNLFNLGGTEEDEDPNIHTLGLSACLCSGRVRPHVGIAVPVGELSDLVDVFVLGGVSATFGR